MRIYFASGEAECEFPHQGRVSYGLQLIGGRTGIQDSVSKTHAFSTSYFLVTFSERTQNASPLSVFAILGNP